jgi:hypothetical protein
MDARCRGFVVDEYSAETVFAMSGSGGGNAEWTGGISAGRDWPNVSLSGLAEIYGFEFRNYGA